MHRVRDKMFISDFGFIGVIRDTDAAMHANTKLSRTKPAPPSASHASVANLPLKIFNFILLNIYPLQHLSNLCTVDLGCLIITLGG